MDVKAGRPKVYTEPRRRVVLYLDTATIKATDAVTRNRTEFIERAIREKLERERSK